MRCVCLLLVLALSLHTNHLDAQQDLGNAAQEQPAQEAVVEAAGEDLVFAQVNFDPQRLLLKQYVRVESAFARRVCTLSEQQEAQLKRLDDEWLSNAIASAGDSPFQGLAAGLARFLGAAPPRGANGKATPETIVRTVTKQIDTYIEQLLYEPQRLVYLEEKAAKEQFRRESQALVLIAAIENRIYLSQQQRADLLPGVTQWLADKSLYWQFYFQNDEFLPAIPKSVLKPILDPQQLTALQGLQTHDYDSTQFDLQIVQQQPQAVIEQ